MDIYAPEIAAQGMTQDPDAFCKEIQSLCGLLGCRSPQNTDVDL